MGIVESFQMLNEARRARQVLLSLLRTRPSYVELKKYDMYALMDGYYALRKEDAYFFEKAFEYAVTRFLDGYHTIHEISIMLEYLQENKLYHQEKQLFDLLENNKFCFKHTYKERGPYIHDICSHYPEFLNFILHRISLDNAKDKDSDKLFNAEEIEQVLNDCKGHLELIQQWNTFRPMLTRCAKHSFVGARDTKRMLYSIMEDPRFEQINLYQDFD